MQFNKNFDIEIQDQNQLSINLYQFESMKFRC